MGLDFASASRRVAALGIDEGGSTAGVATSSRLDVPGPSAVAATLSSANISVVAAPTEGDFASAVPPFRILAEQPHRSEFLPYRGWMLPWHLLQSNLRLALVLPCSWILLRLYGQVARRHFGAIARWVGVLSCRPRLFSLLRSVSLIPPVLLLSIALRRWPSHAVILGWAALAMTRMLSLVFSFSFFSLIFIKFEDIELSYAVLNGGAPYSNILLLCSPLASAPGV